MNVDVLAVVDTGDVGSVDQSGNGVTLTFMSGSRALRICFVKGDMFIAFADQVGHVAEDVERMQHAEVVDSISKEQQKRTERRCVHCHRNVMAYADSVCCDMCGQRFEETPEHEGA